MLTLVLTGYFMHNVLPQISGVLLLSIYDYDFLLVSNSNYMSKSRKRERERQRQRQTQSKTLPCEAWAGFNKVS